MSILRQDMLGGSALRLPIDGLPYQAQQIITITAKALDCPKEYVMASAMQAVAQAAGDRFCWDNGVYQDYPQFYSAIVGDSTANKTSAIRKMFKPLMEADSISLQQRREAIAGKTKEERAKTPYTTHLLQDVTTEAYQDALKFNSGGVTQIHDELLSFFDFNRYRKGNDEKFYCSKFANYEPFKIARKGEGIEVIEHPIVRIIGGIQPDVLAGNFSRSEMLNDGMLPRFLWFIKPADFRLDEQFAKIDTTIVESQWRQIVWRIIDQKQPVKVMFNSNSEALYDGYIRDNKRAKNAQSLFGYEAAVCGKLEIYAIMWAMTTAILRYAELGDTEEVLCITEGEMSYTLRCMEYFRASAMKVYDTITAGSVPKKRDCILGLKDYINNQSQFAESIGVSQGYVSQVLGGHK